jgi:predicted TIM-barrel fold metal-dependent hydrolase
LADIERSLADFDDLCLEAMDKAGIDLAVLSVTTPGVRAEADAALRFHQAPLRDHHIRVCAPGLLAQTIAALDEDSVMFSVDYPYEETQTAATFIECAHRKQRRTACGAWQSFCGFVQRSRGGGGGSVC